jgi:Uma2 family endonuclease
MVALREPQRMTVDDWRKLERTSHAIKHEFVDGRSYALPGGSLAHGRIGLNARLALESALLANNKLCFVYNSDVATRLSPTRYTYPDASVSCDECNQPAPDKTEVQAACVVVEAAVLSHP